MAIAKATSAAMRSSSLFRSVIVNYVIRQHLFDHLPPRDIANVIYATDMGLEIGTKGLEIHLHPMRYVFANAELDIISKRIAEGYAIVLLGRDLKELVDIIEKQFSWHGRSVFLRPQLRTFPRLQLAITDFSPPNVPIPNKPTLPDFGTCLWVSSVRCSKMNCPAAGVHLTHYESSVSWDGSATVLPLT